MTAELVEREFFVLDLQIKLLQSLIAYWIEQEQLVSVTA